MVFLQPRAQLGQFHIGLGLDQRLDPLPKGLQDTDPAIPSRSMGQMARLALLASPLLHGRDTRSHMLGSLGFRQGAALNQLNCQFAYVCGVSGHALLCHISA